MSSSKLILLTGSQSIEEPSTSSEPYRVIWNPQVMYGDYDRYVSGTSTSGFSSEALNTAVLTDYAPLGFEPVMLMRDLVPVDINVMGYPILTATRPRYSILGARIDRILDIAHPDRRGKLPKVFQLRFVSTDNFTNLLLLKYSLDSFGTREICLHCSRSGDETFFSLSYFFADGNKDLTNNFVVRDTTAGARITESLRFIIFDNHLELRYGDPGEVQLTLPLPEPVTATPGAHLRLFDETAGQSEHDTPVIFGIDGLYIYDGYF